MCCVSFSDLLPSTRLVWSEWASPTSWTPPTAQGSTRASLSIPAWTSSTWASRWTTSPTPTSRCTFGPPPNSWTRLCWHTRVRNLQVQCHYDYYEDDMINLLKRMIIEWKENSGSRMCVLKRKSDVYEHLILVIRHFFKNRIKKQIKWNENNIYNNKVSLLRSIHPFFILFYFILFNTLLKDTRKN